MAPMPELSKEFFSIGAKIPSEAIIGLLVRNLPSAIP
jgi:hypothetical protein